MEISLRDYFAGHVVQGLMANEFETLDLFKGVKEKKEKELKQLASVVYKIADALIEERNKSNDKLN